MKLFCDVSETDSTSIIRVSQGWLIVRDYIITSNIAVKLSNHTVSAYFSYTNASLHEAEI
jgi:hypothetical protein